MALTDLLRTIMNDCALHNVELRLINDRQITQSGSPCGGLFSSEERVLAVAVGDHNWIRFLVHEYGHMQQALEGQFGMNLHGPAPRSRDHYEIFNSWLHSGKNVHPKQLRNHVLRIIECELDADRRALDLLTWHGVYSADLYAIEANQILYAYSYALQTRKWVLPHATAQFKRAIIPHLHDSAIEYLSIPPNLFKLLSKVKT